MPAYTLPFYIVSRRHLCIMHSFLVFFFICFILF